jgi:hypothetical protein
MRVYTPVGKKEHGQFALDVRWKKINKENNLEFI